MSLGPLVRANCDRLLRIRIAGQGTGGNTNLKESFLEEPQSSLLILNDFIKSGRSAQGASREFSPRIYVWASAAETTLLQGVERGEDDHAGEASEPGDNVHASSRRQTRRTHRRALAVFA